MAITFIDKKKLKTKYKKLYYKYLRIRILLKKILVSDKRYVENKFVNNFGVKPNITNPKRFNEHITKILMTEPDDLITQCVDKYAVRDYVEKKVGKIILNDLIGVYSNYNEILKDFERYPKQFVIKATHGSAWNYICKDKDDVNFTELKILVNHWLRSNCYYIQRAKVYKHIPPRIICEKYLEDESGGLVDYKVHCINGEPKFINVLYDRHTSMKANVYDLNWNLIDVRFDDKYPNDKRKFTKKPEQFDLLLEYSRALSREFHFVRVDYYIVKGNIIFGELTFTPGHGAFKFNKEKDLFWGKFFDD